MLRWRNFARSVTAWIGNRSRAVKELVLIGVLLPPLFVVLLWANAFDLFHGWSRHHEHWQLDEIVVLAFFLGLAAMVFSWRRLRELKRETSSRKDVEKNAFEIERRDVLTGVGNRKRFVEEIGRWAFHLPDGEACAVYLLDLDHFKPINDLYGHRLGDEVLRVVACRLSDSLEDGGLVTRLSGDEFGLLIRYPKGGDAPARLARRIVRVIATPIHVGALTVEVGEASVWRYATMTTSST